MKEKTVLVTGGARGIGAAVCDAFLARGARTAFTDIDEEVGRAREAELGGRERALFIKADASDKADAERMVAETVSAWGRLDVLVNNAGIGLTGKRASSYVALMARQAQEMATRGRIETHCDTTIDLGDEDWDRMLRIHLYGAFYCSREALRIMKEQGSGATSNGKIINMGSIMGTSGGAGAVDYCAAKAGIHGFTRALAREVASRNIQVNAIAPGFVDTPLLGDMHAAYPLIAAATPLGRLGKPDDVAWAAVYLASCEADWVTGQVLSPNGGWHMSQ